MLNQFLILVCKFLVDVIYMHPDRKRFGLASCITSLQRSTDHIDPSKIAATVCRGSDTVSSNISRLWCAKYPQSTLRIMCEKLELTTAK